MQKLNFGKRAIVLIGMAILLPQFSHANNELCSKAAIAAFHERYESCNCEEFEKTRNTSVVSYGCRFDLDCEAFHGRVSQCLFRDHPREYQKLLGQFWGENW
jgi:hypothetical protein